MSKIPVIFKIELTIEEAKDKIGVGEESHRKASNRSPISNFLIINRPGNHCAGERMSNAIHNFIITWKRSLRQMGGIFQFAPDELEFKEVLKNRG
jgi:hypothetical protein